MVVSAEQFIMQPRTTCVDGWLCAEQSLKTSRNHIQTIIVLQALII